jgi:hypothetical protein
LRFRLAANVTMLTTPGYLKLANDAFYLIDFAVFQCTEYPPLNYERKTKDFIFFVLQSVSRTNTLNMKTSLLGATVISSQIVKLYTS